MLKKRVLSDRAKRKRLHDPLRTIAAKVVRLIGDIEAVERRFALPASPYRELLGAIEEYHNQLADEFDDPPDQKQLATYSEGMDKVREINRACCDNPLAPIEGSAEAYADVAAGRKRLGARNAGPNADIALDILSDVKGMLAEGNAKEALELLGEIDFAEGVDTLADLKAVLLTCPGVDTTEQTTGSTYREIIEKL